MKLEDLEFYDNLKDINILFLGMFGSKLHGSNHKDSDTDLKGIYMPTKRDIYLGRTEKSIRFKTNKDSSVKNSGDDTEIELYSLNYFINIALKGDTSALDMLFTPNEQTFISSAIWEHIVSERQSFLSKESKCLIGYAKTQAAKYGVKGDRLAAMKEFLDYCDRLKKTVFDISRVRLYEDWTNLPEGKHFDKINPEEDGKTNLRLYSICGQQHQETATFQYVYDSVNKKYLSYGERARKAQENDGIDWKALSHAIRAGFEYLQVLTINKIEFPLSIGPTLRKIKLGEMDYNTEVMPLMDDLIAACETLSKTSNLQEKTDHTKWEDWLVRTIQKEVFGEILAQI